jgi:hypothetical protein
MADVFGDDFEAKADAWNASIAPKHSEEAMDVHDLARAFPDLLMPSRSIFDTQQEWAWKIIALRYHAAFAIFFLIEAHTRAAVDAAEARIVAWLRGEIKTAYTDPQYDIGINLADAIERGEHRRQP